MCIFVENKMIVKVVEREIGCKVISFNPFELSHPFIDGILLDSSIHVTGINVCVCICDI